MSSRTENPPVPERLARPVADSHTHLDMCATDGGPSVAESLEWARAAGITKVIQVGCDVAGSQWAADTADEFDDVWAAVALHPNEAPRIHAEQGLDALEAAWGQIRALAERPSVRAIGETGMDFYRTEHSGRAAQEESFRFHIGLAKETGKTLVVHDRESHSDVLRILDDEGHPDTVVLHCFSGDEDFAREADERGWYCSFAGTATFKNAPELRAAAQIVSLDRLLVESDAPFLTPMPYRGQRNGSFLVALTTRLLADLRDLGEAETADLLMANTARAFGPL